MTDMKHYVYVIGIPEGPVKIGVSNNPENRVGNLQPGCPFPLQLLSKYPAKDRAHAFEHERNFHTKYRKYRLVGEWFDMDADFAANFIEINFSTEAYFDECLESGISPSGFIYT